jgi:peptidoglycan/xylan/chitin deacetylase (PgdA/CDA1 family)
VNDVLVLCYHALSDGWPADLSTTPDLFEAQLELLLGRGYEPATFERAITDRPARRTVAVTFDDAYRSVLERGFPIMERLGVPGTVFVPTAWAGRPEPMAWDGIDNWLGTEHEPELRCMDWTELQTLARAGWEIGSHTRSHPRLTRVEDTQLHEELRQSRSDCEEGLGRPCRSIAYPYGDVDPRVVAATREAGYEVAAALPRRLGSTQPLDWPRVGVYHADDLRRFRLKVSPLLRRIRSGRVWGAVTGSRRAA